MQKTPLCAIMALIFSFSTAQATTAPMVDGVSNGVSTKYNKNCLDVAYKNAYEEADGKKTDSSTFPNYKCYKDGKEIYCNEVREDGQTENAKTDHFVNQLPDGLSCVGVPESQKVYEGSVVSCDDVAYKNGYCKASGVSPCDLSGFKCYQDRVATACSDVTDEAQNEKAETDYLATAMATTKSLEGTFFVGDVVGSKVFPEQQQNTRYIGQAWHTWTYQEPVAKPAKGGLLEFVYIPASSTSGVFGGRTTVSFPDSVAQVYLTKTVHVTCNGITIDLNFQADYTENTNIGEIRHRNFYIDGDVFGLSSKIGQTLEYKIWWD